MRHRIVLIDEDLARGAWYARVLGEAAEVLHAGDSGEAWRVCAQGADLVAVSPAAGSSTRWLEFIRAYTAQQPQTPVILLATDGSEELAVAAFRSGVRDYLKGPVSPEALLAAVRGCLPRPPGSQAERNDNPDAPHILVGGSESMRRLRNYLPLVGQSDCSVLITGETGTGKELVAECIHASSARRSKPLVCLNCAAIPETLLESELFGYERGAFTGAASTKDGKMRQADGGTLFLDEIGEMSLCAQAKILRAIETKVIQRLGGSGSIHVNLRIIAATNEDLESLIERKLFRQDLYFRLNVARISLPALRERRDDIPHLLEHYLEYFNRKAGQQVRGFSPSALEALCSYSWPGNVRELKNTVEAILIVRPYPAIELSHLPEHIAAGRGPAPSPCPGEADRDRLVDALRVTNWNKTKAARALKWSRMTLYRKMAKYGISDHPDGTSAGPETHAS